MRDIQRRNGRIGRVTTDRAAQEYLNAGSEAAGDAPHALRAPLQTRAKALDALVHPFHELGFRGDGEAGLGGAAIPRPLAV
jgi:hypothetical protein